MERGQVSKMYLFGKNRAKGRPEQNGCSYGPPPIKNRQLFRPSGARKRQHRARPGTGVVADTQQSVMGGGGERLLARPRPS